MKSLIFIDGTRNGNQKRGKKEKKIEMWFIKMWALGSSYIYQKEMIIMQHLCVTHAKPINWATQAPERERER